MKAKKLFLGMLAIAGMLYSTSCTKDEIQSLPVEGEFVEATFTIGTGDVLNTRAWVNGEQIGTGSIGDGSKADVVACAVYDSEGNELEELTDLYVPVNEKKAVFTTRLAKGQSYRVAFFAYNKAAEAYDVTDLKNIKVKNDQKCNNDNRDAFTAYTEVSSEETMNSVTKDVTLKRPFAQLNLGIDATELRDAANAGVVVAKSYIKVSNVYDSFSAYDDAVVTTDEPVSMEFDFSAIPDPREETLDIKEGDKVNSYTYLAMNYLLVGNVNSEKTLTDIEFVWANEDGSKTNSPATKFINIPVERNYRTNIIGKLITSPATFNISIDQNFTGDKNPVWVSTWDEFDAAVKNNKSYIILNEDITYNQSYTLTSDVTINLNGKSLTIDNPNEILYIGNKKNTIKPNVTITNGKINCIVYGLSGNVSLTDINFGGTIAYGSAAQGVINQGPYANFLIEGCNMKNVKKSGTKKPRSLSTDQGSNGNLILRNNDFRNNSNLDRPYINYHSNNAILEITGCSLYSMASNIDLGASYSWTNMNLTGCSGGFTFTISRASTSLTDEEMAVYKAIKQNNTGSMRFIFTDGEKNNL